MRNIKNFDVKTKGFSQIKLFISLLPMLMLLMTTNMFINQYAYSQGNNSDMTTPATIEELDTGEFSQIVVTSDQINELNNTINNAIKATGQDNMTEVLLELKIIQNQLDLIDNP